FPGRACRPLTICEKRDGDDQRRDTRDQRWGLIPTSIYTVAAALDANGGVLGIEPFLELQASNARRSRSRSPLLTGSRPAANRNGLEPVGTASCPGACPTRHSNTRSQRVRSPRFLELPRAEARWLEFVSISDNLPHRS